MCTLILLVNQVHHHLYHHILLLRLALCNHQRQSHEGIVCKALTAILTVKDSIVIQEPQEQRGSYAFVTIAKRVVLRILLLNDSSFSLPNSVEPPNFSRKPLIASMAFS